MKKLFYTLMILIITSPAYSALTPGKIPKVKTGSTTPSIENSIITESAGNITVAGNISATNLSGTNTGDQTTVSGNAGTVTVSDAGGDTTTSVLLGTDATGSLSPRTDAGITYNATTNALTATTFIGALTGNADTVTTNANLTGDVTSSGNATTISANSVALATDTTGNYVATIADSGASEVTVANSGTENAAITLAIASGITRDSEWDTASEINSATTDNDFVLDTASIDWGGKTSFEIPNAGAPTVDAFGEIAGDNDLWAVSRGAPVFFDGTASTALINVLVSDAPSNGQVPKWNTGGTITWEDDTQSAGAATAWDDIADPDAAASINFAGFDQDITSAEDGGDILTITNSDADRAADSIILNLSDNDGADASAIYLRMIGDADGTPTNDYTFAQDGFTSLLTVTAPTLTLSGTGTINGLDAIDATTETTLESAIDIAGEVTGTGLGAVVIADSVTVTGWVMGASTATTPSADDNDTSLATTAYVQTEINAMGGRSLTASSGSMDADVELYTSTKCVYIEDPVAADDLKSIWINDSANGFTLTKLWCESDQTATLMLQVDDGTPADVDSVDLACISTPDTDTSLDGDATMAAGDRLDLDVASVSGTPTWVSICWTGTYDD